MMHTWFPNFLASFSLRRLFKYLPRCNSFQLWFLGITNMLGFLDSRRLLGWNFLHSFRLLNTCLCVCCEIQGSSSLMHAMSLYAELRQIQTHVITGGPAVPSVKQSRARRFFVLRTLHSWIVVSIINTSSGRSSSGREPWSGHRGAHNILAEPIFVHLDHHVHCLLRWESHSVSDRGMIVLSLFVN
eukprot:Gb_36807 [translate_table: standard]